MYWVLIVLVTGAVCSNIPDSTAIQPVGAFSNMRFTEEHAYGYTVELWKAGRCLFGLFEASEGLSGDTPTGRLQPVSYDAATGKLGFAAKLTMGVTKPKDGADWVPSRDSFDFTGHLSSRALQGRLSHSDQFRPEAKAPAEAIVLSLSKEQQELMIQAASFGEWRKQAEAILRARGPKW
jgi:hypothetical protein